MPMPVMLGEKEVQSALAQHNGNLHKAASVLGITQAWLSKWLKKNGFTRKVEWTKKTDGAA